MIGDLVKFANRLDKLGLSKEADAVDSFVRKLIASGEIKKIAQQSDEIAEIDRKISEIDRKISEIESLDPASLSEEQEMDLEDLKEEKLELTREKFELTRKVKEPLESRPTRQEEYEEAVKGLREDIDLATPSTWPEVSGISERNRMLRAKLLFGSSSIGDLIENKKINVPSSESLKLETISLLYTFLTRLSDPREEYPARVSPDKGNLLQEIAPNIFKFNDGKLEFSSNEYKERRIGVERTYRERERYRTNRLEAERSGKPPEEYDLSFHQKRSMHELFRQISDEEKRAVATALGPAESGTRKLINLLKRGYKGFTLDNLSQKMSDSLNDTSDQNWEIFPGFRLFKESEESEIGYVTRSDVNQAGGIINFTKAFLDTLASLGFIYKVDTKNAVIYVGSSQMIGSEKKIDVTPEGEAIESSEEEDESVLEKLRKGEQVDGISSEDIERLMTASQEKMEESKNINVEVESRQIAEAMRELKETKSYKKVESIMRSLEDRSESYGDKYPQLRNKIIEMQSETARILNEIGTPLEETGARREAGAPGASKFFTRVLSIDDRRNLFNTPIPEETILRKAMFLSEIFTDEEMFVCASLTPSICDDRLKREIRSKTQSELISNRNLYIKSLDQKERGSQVLADQPKLREELTRSIGELSEVFGGRKELTDREVIAAVAASYTTAISGNKFGKTESFKIITKDVRDFILSNFKEILSETFEKFKKQINEKSLEMKGIEEEIERQSSLLADGTLAEEERSRISSIISAKEKDKQDIISTLKSLSKNIALDSSKQPNVIDSGTNDLVYKNLFNKEFLVFLARSRGYDSTLPAALLLLKASINNFPIDSPIRSSIAGTAIQKVNDAKSVFAAYSTPKFASPNESQGDYSQYGNIVISGVVLGDNPDKSYFALKESIKKINILDKNYTYGFPQKYKEIPESLWIKYYNTKNTQEYYQNPDDIKFAEINQVRDFIKNPESKEYAPSPQAVKRFFSELDAMYNQGNGEKIKEDDIKNLVTKVLSEDKGVSLSDIKFNSSESEQSAGKITRSFNLILDLATKGIEEVAKEISLKAPEKLNKNLEQLVINKLAQEAERQFESLSPVSKKQTYYSYADPNFVTNIVFLAQDQVYSRVKENLSAQNEVIKTSGIINLLEDNAKEELESAAANSENVEETYNETYNLIQAPREIEGESVDGWTKWLQKLVKDNKEKKANKNIISPLAIKEMWYKSCANISVIPLLEGYTRYIENPKKRKEMIMATGRKREAVVAGTLKSISRVVKDPKTGVESRTNEIVKFSALPNYFSWEKWISEVFEIEPDQVIEKVSTLQAFQAIQMGVDLSDTTASGELVDVLNKYLNNSYIAKYFAGRLINTALKSVPGVTELSLERGEVAPSQIAEIEEEREKNMRSRTQEAEFGATEEEEAAGEIGEENRGENIAELEARKFRSKSREDLPKRRDLRPRTRSIFENMSSEEIIQKLQGFSPQEQQYFLRDLTKDQKKGLKFLESTVADYDFDVVNRVDDLNSVQKRIFLKSLCSLSLGLARNPAQLYSIAPQLLEVTKVQEMQKKYNKAYAVAIKNLKDMVSRGSINREEITTIFQNFPEIQRLVLPPIQSKPKGRKKESIKDQILLEGEELFARSKRAINQSLKNPEIAKEVEILENQEATTSTESAPSEAPQAAPSAPKKKGLGLRPKTSSITYDRYSYINYVNSLLKR